MSRLTLRLPDSLHQQLAEQARREGISLNQYLVYSLVSSVTAADIEYQQKTFEALKSRFPADQSEQALEDLLGSRLPNRPGLEFSL